MDDDVLIPAKLSEEKEIGLKKFLRERILELKFGMSDLYERKIVKWTAAYEARPREETRQFPFQNASNLIVPIVAIHTDTLHAQVMAAIFKTRPIVVTKIFGDIGKEVDLLKDAYQEFMEYVCIEPQELDLYRVYNEGFREYIKYGTVTYKCPYEEKLRDFLLPGGDGTGQKYISETIYTGPRPEKLPFTGFYIPPTARGIDDAQFKAHKRVMNEYELNERKFAKIYENVDKVLASPDRTTPEQVQKSREETLGAKTESGFGYREWDVWECYITWRYGNETYAPRMIATYHEKSDTLLRCLYDNFRSEWFVGARLAPRDDMYHGYGFAEILWGFQEGASETYNGYRDNQTVANTRMWRVSPDSKLHQGYKIYPSAMLPAEKDEVEPMSAGDVSQVNIDDLRLLLELAERRSGVSPPQQGYGAGVFTGKRGVYSAMGTLALMQEGNSRKDLNVSDSRDAHVRLMRLVTNIYGVFGDNEFHRKRLATFGEEKAALIKRAISEILRGRIALPVYSSTASVNKEVEKQNDIYLSMVMNQHYQMIAQLLGSILGPMTPPQVKEYLVEVIKASDHLMKEIMRNFGHDDVDQLVPEAKGIEQGGQGDVQRSALVPGSPNPGMARIPGSSGVQ